MLRAIGWNVGLAFVLLGVLGLFAGLGIPGRVALAGFGVFARFGFRLGVLTRLAFTVLLAFRIGPPALLLHLLFALLEDLFEDVARGLRIDGLLPLAAFLAGLVALPALFAFLIFPFQSPPA